MTNAKTYRWTDLQDKSDFSTGNTFTEICYTANEIFQSEEDWNAFEKTEEEVIEALLNCDYLVEEE
jgi:hypothetical protein